MSQAGIDSPAQSHASYEASALPSSRGGLGKSFSKCLIFRCQVFRHPLHYFLVLNETGVFLHYDRKSWNKMKNKCWHCFSDLFTQKTRKYVWKRLKTVLCPREQVTFIKIVLVWTIFSVHLCWCYCKHYTGNYLSSICSVMPTIYPSCHG